MSRSLAELYESLYAPLYFAAIVSTAFYGVSCMQTFFYFVRYQNDLLRIKILVVVLWALNTIHEALTIAGAYKYIMNGFINPLSYETARSELVLQYLMTVLVALPTQGFFVYRIYVFSGRKTITLPVAWAILACIAFVSSTIYVGKALYTSADGVHVVPLSVINTGLFETVAILSLIVAAVTDILIAICMTFLLLRERATTNFAKTAHLLQRLTLFAVNTGIWTATFALLTIILLHLFPEKALYTAFSIPLCSVYCNTLLANLNVRSYVLEEATARDIELSVVSSLRVSNGPKHNTERGDADLVSTTQ